jgi:zinc protease
MDRSIAPAYSSTLDFKLPTPQKIQVGNASGNSIIFLPYSQTPITKLEFVFRAGRAAEPHAGLSQFTTNLLDKGIPDKSAKDIAAFFDYYGAHVELSADADYATLSLYCLAQHVSQFLPVLLDMVSAPTFPKDELEKYRAVFIENLKVNKEKNSYLASIAMRKTLFSGHPYGHSTEVEDAQAITQASIQAFFQSHFLPYKIFVTGHITDAELKMLSHYLSTNAQLKEIDNPAIPKHNPDTILIAGPGKDQASIRLGKHTIGRTTTGISELTLLNHLLGGFFGSRLMHNIREEKGLTYGIYSSIQHLTQASSLVISAEVNKENVDEALQEIKKELTSLQALVSNDELQKSKNHLIGSIQNDNASIFAISERIKSLELNNLSARYYNDLLDSIAHANPEYLATLAYTHLNPDTFSVITVKG